MIGWMQKNNKYLVPTIRTATIAFIGAGAVGWGSMNFGDRSSSIAKIGDITITKMKYSFTLNNAYSQLAQQYGSKFDKAMAKKLGVDKSVYNSLIKEALLLNLAKDNGIIATDKEVANEITNYPAFKGKNGSFDKKIYKNFLKTRGMKPRDFENIIKENLIVKKITKLLNTKPTKFEKEVISSTFKIADKIKYAVLSSKDINITLSDNEIKTYWQKNKLNFLTPKKYKLDLVWTKTNNINFEDTEIEKFYKTNSFEFTDKSGKIKELKDVKDEVVKALTLKKLKKDAAIARSRFKKGKIKAQETIEIAINDKKFTKEIWSALQNANKGDFIKPKAVGSSYVTIHLLDIIKPQPKKYEDAKEQAGNELKATKINEELNKLADSYMKDKTKLTIDSKDYISLSNFKVLPNLTPQDSQNVIRYIFGSNKKTDKVKLKDSIVVYSIEEQKLIDTNNTLVSLDKEINNIKNQELNSNIIESLTKKYKVQKF